MLKGLCLAAAVCLVIYALYIIGKGRTKQMERYSGTRKDSLSRGGGGSRTQDRSRSVAARPAGQSSAPDPHKGRTENRGRQLNTMSDRSSVSGAYPPGRRLIRGGLPGPGGVMPAQFPCCPYDKQRNIPGQPQKIFWDSVDHCYRCRRGHRFKANGRIITD